MQRREILKLLAGTALLAGTNLAAKSKSRVQYPLLLNYNENAIGMSESSKRAITESLSIGSRYPDAQQEKLTEQITTAFKLTSANVSIGSGSSQNIQSIILALAQRAKSLGKPLQLIAPNPTFNYAERYAKSVGIPVVLVELKDDLSFDIEAMKKAAAGFNGLSVYYICNPNNPTAMLTPSSTLNEWIKSESDKFFLVDEAYAELVTKPDFVSAISLLQEGAENLAVVRTFSKLYALAGQRVGYCLSSKKNVEEFNKFLSFDNANLAGLVAASAVFEDEEFKAYSLKSINLSRQIVTDALDKLGLGYADSQANFIFHKINADTREYAKNMKARGIYVGRAFAPLYGYNRLSLGTPAQMQEFVKVLFEFRKQGLV